MRLPACLAACLLGLAGGCQQANEAAPPAAWARVLDVPGAALLSVHGRGAEDVWVVGADAGDGPEVRHWDGEAWRALSTDTRGDLWWVHVAPDGAVLVGGSDATVLRHRGEGFEALPTPGGEGQTVYGLWAARDDSVYAAGSGQGGRGGFLWHFDGTRFVELPLPEGGADGPGLFKVWGTGDDDVWAVGSGGRVLHGNAEDGFEPVPSGSDATLFTVHAAAGRVVMVGGDAGGVILEVEDGAIVDRTPELAPLLQGVSIDASGVAWAVGLAGSIYRSQGAGQAFEPVDPGLDVAAAGVLHAAFTDGQGQLWSAGGNVLSESLDGGLVLYFGAPLSLDMETR